MKSINRNFTFSIKVLLLAILLCGVLSGCSIKCTIRVLDQECSDWETISSPSVRTYGSGGDAIIYDPVELTSDVIITSDVITAGSGDEAITYDPDENPGVDPDNTEDGPRGPRDDIPDPW